MRTRVRELTVDAERAREDRVATEEPLEIRLGWPAAAPRRVWLTMRTPGHDFELATGWLVHEGLVLPGARAAGQVAGQVERVAYCTDVSLAAEEEFNVVTVTLDGPPAGDLGHRHAAASAGSSACGVCGKDSVGDALRIGPGLRWSGELPAAATVRDLPGRLRERQSVFARTGGVHAAALATSDGELVVVREDVGRHNAVDKVTGARVLGGADPAEAALVVSGRAGFELVQKAVVAGVGCLVAVGAPSSLAVRLAVDAGLGLFGFTRADRVVRYA